MTQFVHDVDLPNPGGSINTWGSELNSVFDGVLHKIAEFGPKSEIEPGGRLEAGTDGLRENQLFVATDTNPNSIHRYNGYEWILIFDGGAEDIGGAIQANSLSISGWDVIDVSNHGYPGDESGGDIVPFLMNNPDSIFVFPEGRYLWDTGLDTFNATDTWSRIALIGKPEATMVANTADVDKFLHTGYDSSDTDTLLLENLKFEVDGANGLDAGIGTFAINESVHVQNVELVGQRRRAEYGGDKYGFRLNMLGDHSVGFVNNLKLIDGDAGAVSSNFGGAIGISVEPPNEGTIFWNGCHVEGWPDNGMYLKDGTGRSIAVGCTADNCGNQNMRLGKGDQIHGGRFRWTVDPATVDYAGGACLEIEHGQGSAVYGAQVVADYAATDIVRTRGANEHVKFQDVHIENNTAQFSIDCSSSQTPTGDPDEPHGEGYAIFENVRIVNDHAGTSAIRSATVRTTRDNTVFRDCSIETRNPNISVAPVRVDGGNAEFENCRFVQHADSNANYTAIVGPSDSSVTVENVTFDGCEFNGSAGPYFYGGDVFDHVAFVGCDFTNVSGSLFPAVDPQDEYDAGNISEFVFFRNRPYTESTDYGSIAQRDMATETLDVGGLAQLPYFYGANIDTSTNAEWYKIAELNGAGANCKVIITENSRTGNTHETGIEFCAFKNGNDVHEHGGFWYQMAQSHGRILEGDFGFIDKSDDTTGNIIMDIYYKAAPFTRSSAIVLDGDGVNYDFQNVGQTEPTGIEYIDSVFPVASPAEFANGIQIGQGSTDPVPTSDAERKFYVSSTAPTDATANDIWFEPQ